MKLILKRVVCIVLFFAAANVMLASGTNDGSKLWFTNFSLPADYNGHEFSSVVISEYSPTFEIIQNEFISSLNQLFTQNTKSNSKTSAGSICIGTLQNDFIANSIQPEILKNAGSDGFIIKYLADDDITIIAANTDNGCLYGTYHFLRLLCTNPQALNDLIVENPAYKRRILNHWDNLDGTVERGYAGRSIWLWDDLPEKLNPRIIDYARANASIGINGTVLNNVNASPAILKEEYLQKVKVVADVLRPYGIQVYLSVNFSSPKILGGLPDSDPLKPEVKDWWNNKVAEIYQLIPDFGGFVVKANSEGQPGPQDYGRTHADGANMLADALNPYKGIVMWRAFVYNPSGDDRAKQAYNEFKPLDGKFRNNVMIQVKNGPVDFQPREPISPLFGAMEHTTLIPELQITKEYLGFSDHWAYLGTLFQEFLQTDTYQKGRNTTVSRVTNGDVFNDSITGIAGVSNIGQDINWCGSHSAQANWYVFGRLAWNPDLPAKTIAEEWLEQTFSHNTTFIKEMGRVMMESREAVVNYMTPLGLHHLMGWSHHYGPEPWCEIPGARPDWLPTYYHKADSYGIGFNRSSTGSNAVEQYAEPLKTMFDDPQLCPEKFLLWFHHLPWDYTMSNGRELWDELCYKYSEGVTQAKRFRETWNSMEKFVDERQFKETSDKLDTQVKEAIWWRDACLLYFQTFSKREIPAELDEPVHQLDELKKLKFDLKHHN
ncbi:alpha-glucuronidase family glycosyl hydrolase [Draconibacterium sp. IB214405]|uniref:alpha-glucuronidase family glycosyl hydrolase n=1 Tax=Draconibacterium sp. IB214405 TaxID=3097352 RepID=UPI002A183856|nr:alpha-glucuronidase family glycosyl hydrolase [Draconibacterium sp. IB214405]MDX8339597.1 alpha-glucuronidase family glycosyl hydrolase [Draconibacterium sp. IB214405]